MDGREREEVVVSFLYERERRRKDSGHLAFSHTSLLLVRSLATAATQLADDSVMA